MRARKSLQTEEQMLLFEPASSRPHWRSLPEPARRETLQIMTSLLRQWRTLPPPSPTPVADKREGADE